MSAKKNWRRAWNRSSSSNWPGEYLGQAATRVSWVRDALHEFVVGGGWMQTYRPEVRAVINGRKLVGVAGSVAWWKCVKAWGGV